MAGQLGLNPPTMTLCDGGTTSELEKALENSEAVAKCFNCSISASAIFFAIYCSANIPSSETLGIQDKVDQFLKKMKLFHLDKASTHDVIVPIFLYVLVPDLPKGYFFNCHLYLGFSHHIYAIGGSRYVCCFWIGLNLLSRHRS